MADRISKLCMTFGPLQRASRAPRPFPNEVCGGEGWAVLAEGGALVLEFLAARHGGGVDRYAITNEERCALQAGQLTVDALIWRCENEGRPRLPEAKLP